ncbi:MAG: HNH endonuclease [Rikenellaceae bacterium]
MEEEKVIYISIFAMPINDESIAHMCNITLSSFDFPNFAKIFQLDRDGNLPFIQYSNENYFKRLEYIGGLFKRDIKQSRGIIKYLERITAEQYFFLIITDEPLIFSIVDQVEVIQKLYKYNNKSFPYIPSSILCSTYNIDAYSQGGSKRHIGEPDRSLRVCRFCGKSYSETTFRNKSHAISEAFGNKDIICNEECDACNYLFSETLERDLYNHIGLIYALHNIKGKNGLRKIRGNAIVIDENSVKLNVPDFAPNMEGINGEHLQYSIVEDTMKFTPQNIYKCFCKFAISVINKEYLQRLTKTIEWLSSDKMYKKLPPVWRKNSNSPLNPSIAIYTRKELNDTDSFEFVVRLILFEAEYIYTFPYIDGKKTYLNKRKMRSLNEIFLCIGDNSENEFVQVDYSSIKLEPVRVDLNLLIPQGVANENIQ